MLPLLALSIAVLIGGQSPAQGPMTAKEIFAKYRPAVVQIETNFHEGKEEMVGSGTGFFFTRDDLIATAFHVVDKAESITIKDSDGNTYEAKAVAWNKKADTAIIGLKKHSKRLYFSRRDFAQVVVGETIFTIGNPLGVLPDTISQGIVSGKREDDNVHYVQITAPISHGNSGGPVIDDRGHAVGLVDLSITEGQNINLAVSADEIEKLASGSPAWVDLSDYVAGNKKDNLNPPDPVATGAKSVVGKALAADPICSSPLGAGDISAMGFSPDGAFAAASSKNRLFLFAGDKLAKDIYFDTDFSGLAFLDAKHLYGFFVDGTYQVLDPASGKVLENHRIGLSVDQAKFSHDGKTLYFCENTVTSKAVLPALMAFDVASRQLRTLSNEVGFGSAFDTSHDGTSIVGFAAHTIKGVDYEWLNVIPAAGGKARTILRQQVSERAGSPGKTYYNLVTAAFSPNGAVVGCSSMGLDFFGTFSARVELIDTSDRASKRKFDLDTPAWQLDFTPDGKYLWMGLDHAVACLDLETGEQEFRIPCRKLEALIPFYALSPKGDRVMVSLGKGVLLYRLGPPPKG